MLREWEKEEVQPQEPAAGCGCEIYREREHGTGRGAGMLQVAFCLEQVVDVRGLLPERYCGEGAEGDGGAVERGQQPTCCGDGEDMLL